jgi:hypothetical protein
MQNCERVSLKFFAGFFIASSFFQSTVTTLVNGLLIQLDKPAFLGFNFIDFAVKLNLQGVSSS